MCLPVNINLFLKQNQSSVSIFAFMQCLSRQREISQFTVLPQQADNTAIPAEETSLIQCFNCASWGKAWLKA